MDKRCSTCGSVPDGPGLQCSVCYERALRWVPPSAEDSAAMIEVVAAAVHRQVEVPT